MKFSVNWLKEYIEVKLPAQELADRLTMAGLEVDAVETPFAFLQNVVLGHIVECAKHPDADKLQLCKVTVGTDTVRDIVCGAPNARAGMQVAVALPGVTLPNGLTIKPAKIRGQKSEGMLCSEVELGLSDDHNGIMDLAIDLPDGTPLSTALMLNSATIEIDLTPNRVDCAAILGIAREAAPIQQTELRKPIIETKFDNQATALHQATSVTVQAKDHCPRYAARLVKNVKIKPSPQWLKSYLLAIGLRPINNIVDITNFVLMEAGQPLHAFDYDTLAGQRIVVKTATNGDKFTTLDGKERVLDNDMLMICDAEKYVGVAGVMGGLNSEITANTQNVLIESAYFAPASVRKTSKKLGLKTDASFRFERGVDPNGLICALDRAADLMVRLAEGELVAGLIDEQGTLPQPVAIDLDLALVHKILELPLTLAQVSNLLTSVEFICHEKSASTLTVTVPTFRVDVLRPEDLIEEVARLYGYDNIPVNFPVIATQVGRNTQVVDFNTLLKIKMAGLGFNEVVTYNFVPAQSCDKLGFTTNDPRRNVVQLLNPLSEELAVLRSSLITGLLQNMGYNVAHQQKNLKTFEIGKTFVMAGQELPVETEMLAALWTGARNQPSWLGEIAADFYDLKGAVESLLAGLHINQPTFVNFMETETGAYPYFKPGHGAVIMLNNRVVGGLGEINPTTLKNFGLKQATFVMELDIAMLKSSLAPVKYIADNTRFPATARDITLVVDKAITAVSILNFILGSKTRFMENAEIVAVFEGEKLGADKKSLSFRMHYRDAEKTLEDADVNPVHTKLSKKLMEEFKALQG